MLTSFVLLFAPMAAAQSGVPATAETEMLGVDVPDEFEVGYQARNDTQQMIELVDPPETVETWTRLITLQSFFGAAQKESARTFYERWRAGMHRTCVGMTDAVFVGVVDGKPAIRGDLSCPKNPQTGKPENVSAVLVQGDANLMMAQVAFRQSVTPKDKELIDRVTGSLKVCDQRARPSCEARKAVGFVPTK